MNRRIVPATFWVGILLFVTLALAGSVGASKPEHVPKLVGPWDGFFLDADSGTPGLVRSDITRQHQGSVVGIGTLLDLEARVISAYNFHARVAEDGFIAGTGQSPMGRLALRGDLTFSRGKRVTPACSRSITSSFPRGALRAGSTRLCSIPSPTPMRPTFRARAPARS